MSENQRCQCTVLNNSSHDLVNAEYGADWGKWANPEDGDSGSNPGSVIKAGQAGWWLLSGRAGSASGAEGWVKYEVGASGVIQFNFECPWSGNNKASCDVSAPIEYRVYASTDAALGKLGAETDISKYDDREGAIPPSGSPLAVLWVISDLSI